MERKKHSVDGVRSKVGTSFWVSGLASLVSVILTVVPVGISVFHFAEEQSSHFLFMAIVVSGSAMLLTAIFTFILSRRERGPSHLAKFKDDLTAAYLNALRQSKLNPANGGHP